MANVSFSIDKPADEIADFIAKLSEDRAIREAFVKDPNATLKQGGITVGPKIDGSVALAALDEAIAAEGRAGTNVREVVAAFVLAGIRVGLRPVISVAVRVVSGTPAAVR
jgi:hypothetical protein